MCSLVNSPSSMMLTSSDLQTLRQLLDPPHPLELTRLYHLQSKHSLTIPLCLLQLLLLNSRIPCDPNRLQRRQNASNVFPPGERRDLLEVLREKKSSWEADRRDRRCWRVLFEERDDGEGGSEGLEGGKAVVETLESKRGRRAHLDERFESQDEDSKARSPGTSDKEIQILLQVSRASVEDGQGGEGGKVVAEDSMQGKERRSTVLRGSEPCEERG